MEVTISRGSSNHGTPLFTCNTCGLSFPTADLQRLHMKTEWHRYNLKRRVAQLPPISAEIFAEKILQQQNQQEEQINTSHRGGKSGKRQVTKKDKRLEQKQQRRLANNQAAEKIMSQIRTENTMEVNSDCESVGSSTFSLGDPIHNLTHNEGDHTDIESSNDFSDIETNESVSIDPSYQNEEESYIDLELKERLKRNKPIPPNMSFITGEIFDTVEENAEHLLKRFGMFIPERDYLVNLTGLMIYLGEKIGLGNMCLFCNYEARSLEAIRAHMLAKSHVKIPYETLEQKLEISDFYDFRSSYDKNHESLDDVENSENGNLNDGEWEDESDQEDEDETELEDDQLGSISMISESGLELEMGNLRAGHRSLARYYKQNLPSATISEGHGTLIAADQRLNYLIKSKDPVENRLQKQAFNELRKSRERERRRETKNINHQAHFRDQLLQ